MDIRKEIGQRLLAPELAEASLELAGKTVELTEATTRHLVLQERVRELEDSDRVFNEMMRFRPVLTLGVLEQMAKLTEVDSRYIDLIRRLMQAEGLTYKPTEKDRLLAVYEARVLAANDPVTERILTIWTDYGFGLKVEVEPVEEGAREVWTEFWTAPRNQPILSERVIHELSDTLLEDGEFFFVFFVSEDDAQVTVRVALTDEVKEIICDPDDAAVPVYYRREWQDVKGEADRAYYRDWRIPDDDDLLDEVELDPEIPIAGAENSTATFMLHAAFRLRGIKELRGWPLLTTGAAWARAYKEFLENRAAVARAVAAVVDKLIVKGGSKQLDVIRSRFTAALDASGRYGLTDVPEAGSTWLENEALTRQRMPLTTGAGDARVDGGALLAQAGLAGGIPPHLLGRGEVVRMAVADRMDDPIYRQFTRYQNFWSSVWNDVTNVVLTMQERYQDKKYETKEARVTTDALVNVVLADLVAVGTVVQNMMMMGFVTADVAQAVALEILRMALHVLGVRDVGEILGKKEEEQERQSQGGPALGPVEQLLLEELCPQCGHVGLLTQPYDQRLCLGCGKLIQPIAG